MCRTNHNALGRCCRYLKINVYASGARVNVNSSYNVQNFFACLNYACLLCTLRAKHLTAPVEKITMSRYIHTKLTVHPQFLYCPSSEYGCLLWCCINLYLFEQFIFVYGNRVQDYCPSGRRNTQQEIKKVRSRTSLHGKAL